jgi:bacterioferritin
MNMYAFNRAEVIGILNEILEAELAGVVRYTHYSFMVFGPDRIPIVTWLREQANESLLHAQQLGELITHLGGHPSLSIGPLLETHQHDTMTILKESLDHETQAIHLYRKLLDAVRDQSVMIEEFARSQIAAEEGHIGEVAKMIGDPSDLMLTQV